MATFQYKNGLGHAAAYQVSGRPFVTGGLYSSRLGEEPLEIKFPTVSKSITFSDWISPDDGSNAVMRVGFSVMGVTGSNYLSLGNTQTPVTIDVKASSVFILGTAADGTGLRAIGSIYASLTSIETGSIPNNWSGSVGIG
jgi:hypothetical protein